MDVQLPIIDGYTATRRIKADPTLRSIPIIAVTSYALDGQEKIARAAGCDDYVPKPYSPRELLAKIRQHLFKPPITCCSIECPLWGVKRTSARHCAIASDCSASSRLSILYFFSVKWLRRAARTEVARDYRRFVVSRLAPGESQVSRRQHQRHSHFWLERPCDCQRRQEPLLQRARAVALIYR